MIIVEGFDWANDWSVFTGPFDKNLVYQFHYYCWDNPVQLNSIKKYLDYQKRFNTPIWVGETGERDNTIYWATTEYFEANNIGWSFWPWKKMDAENGPISVKRPSGWDAVVAFSRGGAKPSRELAQKSFDELLRNIRLENCVYQERVVNAMMRRIPSRIEAENFGQNGRGISYQVKNPNQHSKYYRVNEPVPVGINESRRPRSSQYITLHETEWTSYSIDSLSSQKCEITLYARSLGAPAEAELLINEQPLTVKFDGNQWEEVNPGTALLNRGTNRMKWLVRKGTIDLDWIEVTAKEKSHVSPH